MPLHPDVRALLDRFERDGVRPYDQLTVLQARAGIAAARRLQGEPTAVAHVHDILVDGADGRLPARVYRPDPGQPAPLVVYLHGGGFVGGGIAPADRPCRALAAASGCVIVSVEYRLAPENPHPAPLLDAVAATRWLAAHAADLGGDPAQVVVMGDSAGGALAAGVAIVLRDAGASPLAAQLLLYPTLASPRDTDFASMTENGEGFSMTRGALTWFWDHLLAGPNAADGPPASPLAVADLTGLPPALVVVAEFDPLRDEGIAYAERLALAGVDVRVHHVDGVIHGFWWMDAVLPQAGELTSYLAEVLPVSAAGGTIR